jgi:propionyl-CoA carboxylase alpha chain
VSSTEPVTVAFELEGERVEARLRRFGHRVVVRLRSGLTVSLEETSWLGAVAEAPPPEGALAAPMPGKVTAVSVEKGDSVRAGQVLVVVEAMKMEHPVTSPAGGVVLDVHVAVGQQVDSGDVLVVVAHSEIGSVGSSPPGPDGSVGADGSVGPEGSVGRDGASGGGDG